MRVEWTYPQHGITLSEEVGNTAAALAMVAQWTEVFGVEACGKCGQHDLRFAHRSAQGYDFYEVQCRGCQWRMQFGQRRDDGGLFPKEWTAPHHSEERGRAPAQQEQWQ